MSSPIKKMSGTFMYFAFGSNLLRERIQLRNPTAVFRSVGKLNKFKLDFDYKGRRWFGGVATVTEDESAHVYGCVWELQSSDMKSLDEQEGVSYGIYKPIEVDVTTEAGETVKCRTYQLLVLNAEDKRPSPYYMDVIIRGAKQNSLPQNYIKHLESIEHNGYNGPCTVYDEVIAMIEKQKE